jgi:hypothetical protein
MIQNRVSRVSVGKQIYQINRVTFRDGESLHDEIEIRRSKTIPTIGFDHRSFGESTGYASES